MTQPITAVRLRAVLDMRLTLEKSVIGTCYECDQPITGIQAACRNDVLHPDGECEVIWYHADCIGCFASEVDRQSEPGCGMCARECHVTPLS